MLSLVDEEGRPQNGFLRLYDIYNLNLKASLVVLSACQTALGKEIKGEGLVGLTRAFMYAGAPRVVASLWQIDDRATAEFMRRFYEGMLGNSLRPAAALRAARSPCGRTNDGGRRITGPLSRCRGSGNNCTRSVIDSSFPGTTPVSSDSVAQPLLR